MSLLLSLLLLEIPSIILVYWSFKMYENTLTTSETTIYYKNNDLLEHSGSGLLSAGVCTLGKFGAWCILVWTIIMLLTITIGFITYPKESFRSLCITLAYINMVFIFIIFILSCIMNPPLCIRTIPYFCIQSSISIILYTYASNQLYKNST